MHKTIGLATTALLLVLVLVPACSAAAAPSAPAAASPAAGWYAPLLDWLASHLHPAASAPPAESAATPTAMPAGDDGGPEMTTMDGGAVCDPTTTERGCAADPNG